MYIWLIWPQMVVEHNRITRRRPLGDPRDAPLGGRFGETTELESRVHTINIPPHLSGHQNGIREEERFYLTAHRKKVRRYETTRQ